MRPWQGTGRKSLCRTPCGTIASRMPRSSTPETPRWVPFGALALVSLVAAMPGLAGSWVSDDFHMVGSPYYGHWAEVFRVFTRNAGHYLSDPNPTGPYRPVTMFTLLASHALVPRPWLHHAVSWSLHVVTAASLYVLLLRRVSKHGWRHADGAAFVLAALFLLHPVTVETYVWINGRSDLLAGFWLAMLGLLLLRESPPGPGRLIAIAVVAFLGAGSKLPFIPAAAALWLGSALSRAPLRTGIPVAVGTLAYLALRFHYVPFSLRLGSARSVLTEASIWGSVPHLVAMGADALLGFRAQAMRSLAWTLEQPWSTGEIIAFTAGCALFLGLVWRKDKVGAVYVAGAAAALAPTVVVSQTMWLGFDRYLYMPWMLLLLAIAPHVARAVDALSHRRVLRWGVATALVLTATLGTSVASRFYRNQASFERSLLNDYPDDPTVHFYLASIANKSGQRPLAQQRLQVMPGPPWPKPLIMHVYVLAQKLSDEKTRDVAIGYGLDAYPDDPLLRAHGMRWQYARGNAEEAASLGSSFDVDDPLCPEVKRQLLIWARKAEPGEQRSKLEGSAAALQCAGGAVADLGGTGGGQD